MKRPPESLKSFANHVASQVYSDETGETLRWLKLAGFLGPHAGLNEYQPSEASASEIPPSDRVGIWEPKLENGKTNFIRRMDMMAEWGFWANVGRIEGKGARRRVVLIGESVARGYLYDPEFTPSMALEKILESQFGKGEVEVIDLARTNLAFEVRELAISALQLEPDAVIIFAGNNWNIYSSTPVELAEIGGALVADGLAGAKRISEPHLRNKAKRTVNDISAEYDRRGVPLVWIVPEFNLGEWRDPITNAPHLPGGLNREWLDLLAEAQRALAHQDYNKARDLATQLLEIDRGLCVATLYILAECSRQANDVEAERKYLEMARDANWSDFSKPLMPRCTFVNQQAIREETRRYKCQVIDLPALFKEYLNGGIPGRRLFIDYCHLSSEGIRVAMGAAASSVLRALKRVEVPWYALVDENIAPPRETEAEASFLAAIHNAHCYQPYELLRYYCRRALSLSPHVAESMVNFLESQTRTFLTIVGETVEEILKLGSPLMRHYLLRLNERRLDRSLLDAIVETLAEVGIEAGPKLDALRRQEHSVALRETDLLDYYYCSAAEQPHELAWVTPVSNNKSSPFEARYYRAFWPESRFVFIADEGCPVRLSLTCRVPHRTQGEAAITLKINGESQTEILLSDGWSTWEIDVPGTMVRNGVNEIAIRWPMPEFPGVQALQEAVLRLNELKVPSYYPIFGDIHSFTAADGRAQPADDSVAEIELAMVQNAVS